jgi:hypothetical protein
MSGWVSCWPQDGVRPCWTPSCSLPPYLQGLPLFMYYIFCQMRHELYERLGELLATRGGAALLDLQLLPASLAGVLHAFADDREDIELLRAVTGEGRSVPFFKHL